MNSLVNKLVITILTTRPPVWVERVANLGCASCNTDNVIAIYLSCIINLVILSVTAIILLKIIQVIYHIYYYYIHVQYIDSGIEEFRLKYHDRWVVITGGSDGIGLWLARCFAKNGFKMILLARTESKLNAVKEELETLGSPEVVTIKVDFSLQDDDQYERVKRELMLEQRKIGVLINNVGVVTKLKKFHLHSFPSLKKTINVNYCSTTFMTSTIIEQMHKEPFGMIVNISSCGCYCSCPYFGVYLSLKHAINKMSKALHIEYPQLTCVAFQTGSVETKLLGQDMNHAPLKIISVTDSQTYSSHAFKILCSASSSPGFLKTSGYLGHSLTNFCIIFTETFNLTKQLRFLVGVRSDRTLLKKVLNKTTI